MMNYLLFLFSFLVVFLFIHYITKNSLKKSKSWQKERIEELNSRSQVIETSLGPIECTLEGSGPCVLAIHGGFGGFNQGLIITKNIISQGFKVISPSRPGYLRTPLKVGETPSEQADALAALLDALEIRQVAVLGFSAGFPIALEFALRHSNRTTSVILESLGARPGKLVEMIVHPIFKMKEFVDHASWLFYRLLMRHSLFTIKLLLSSDSFLPHSKLDMRKKYVLSHLSQFEFLKELALSSTPLSVRSTGLMNDIKNLNNWQDCPYSTIPIPTLIIESRSDISYSEAVQISKQLPQAQLLTVEESGHFIWCGENTAEWEGELIDFLKKHHPSYCE
jgi:pimeloyl-ACP methyl ester carboxylesterase